MNHKLHITFFIILSGFICLMTSCGAKQERKELVNMEDLTKYGEGNYEEMPSPSNKLEKSFEADTLNNEQLDVFQQRARQKLQDFINYIELISNKTYDTQLRHEALKQVFELFLDSVTLINVSIDQDRQVAKPIALFLNDVYQTEYDSIKVKIDSVIVYQPHKSTEPMTYRGSISATVDIIGYKNSSVAFESKAIRQGATIIHRGQKEFGKDKMQVWIVSIGEIK